MKLRKPITLQGFDKLATEHDRLRNKERPVLLENIQTAAAEGDRSENAEYIYSKKKLREMDKRLRYLDSILKDAQVIDPAKNPTDQVYFGSTVVVENEEGIEKRWKLVGKGETDHREGCISWDSPVGKGLLGKKVDDFITVSTPKGETELTILTIL